MTKDICDWWYGSRSQRSSEVARGDGLRGTETFDEKAGCYKCDGTNDKCLYYYVAKLHNRKGIVHKLNLEIKLK